MTAPPGAPPPLPKLGERKRQLEAERTEQFWKWRDALEAADGNETQAAEALGIPRDAGHSMTRRFKLTAWARELRAKKTGHARGRQDR
jgi:hypothetical protein